MTEFELIYRYFAQQKAKLCQAEQSDIASVVKSLGDDAAVIDISANANMVSCVDTLIQGRHFSGAWPEVRSLAFAIGFKSVAVNVSDLAAMGATPHHILLALALPKRLATESWLSEFAKGLFHACSQFGVQLIGGDTTQHDSLVISVTAQGFMPPQTSPVYRSGAQVGDRIYVSGTLGDACYALHYPRDEIGSQLSHRLHMPSPRVRLAQALASQGLATAMIDVSDGLAQDLGHLCQQSGVSARLDLEQLPTSSPLQQVAVSQRLRCQLTGGDDYELLFTLPAGIAPPQGHTPVSCIGEVTGTLSSTTSTSISLSYQGSLITPSHPYPFDLMPDLQGFQHFS